MPRIIKIYGPQGHKKMTKQDKETKLTSILDMPSPKKAQASLT